MMDYVRLKSGVSVMCFKYFISMDLDGFVDVITC